MKEFDADLFVGRLGQLISEAGSRKKLSERSGTSDRTIEKWKQGARSPNLNTAADFASSCGVSLDWLVGLSEFRLTADQTSVSLPTVDRALWSVLDPLIDQGIVELSPGVKRELLSRSLTTALARERGIVMTDDKSVGSAAEAVRTAIDQSGLSLEDLAKATGIDVARLEQLQSDKVDGNSEEYLSIAKALNVSPVQFLFPGVDEPLAEQFFEQWQKLSVTDRSEARRVLQLLSRGPDQPKN